MWMKMCCTPVFHLYTVPIRGRPSALCIVPHLPHRHYEDKMMLHQSKEQFSSKGALIKQCKPFQKSTLDLYPSNSTQFSAGLPISKDSNQFPNRSSQPLGTWLQVNDHPGFFPQTASSPMSESCSFLQEGLWRMAVQPSSSQLYFAAFPSNSARTRVTFTLHHLLLCLMATTGNRSPELQ